MKLNYFYKNKQNFMEDKIKNIILDFFLKLSLDIESIEIINKENNIYDVKIKSVDSAIIIGHSGETLADIKNILIKLLNKKLEQKIIIHIEVNDYMESKDKKLFDFINSKIDFVEKTGKEFILPFFSAYERKKIHSYVGDLKNEKIFIKSEGEGMERRIHIYKKEIKLTIDLNGTYI